MNNNNNLLNNKIHKNCKIIIKINNFNKNNQYKYKILNKTKI